MVTARRYCVGIALQVSITSTAPAFPPPPLPLADDEIVAGGFAVPDEEATRAADVRLDGGNSPGAWIGDVTDFTSRTGNPVFNMATVIYTAAKNHTDRALDSAREVASNLVLDKMRCTVLRLESTACAKAAAAQATQELMKTSAGEDDEACTIAISRSLSAELSTLMSQPWALVGRRSQPGVNANAAVSRSSSDVKSFVQHGVHWAAVDDNAVPEIPAGLQDDHPLLTGWAFKLMSRQAFSHLCGELLRSERHGPYENSTTSSRNASFSSINGTGVFVDIGSDNKSSHDVNTTDGNFTRADLGAKNSTDLENAIAKLLLAALAAGIHELCANLTNVSVGNVFRDAFKAQVKHIPGYWVAARPGLLRHLWIIIFCMTVCAFLGVLSQTLSYIFIPDIINQRISNRRRRFSTGVVRVGMRLDSARLEAEEQLVSWRELVEISAARE